MKKDEIVDRMKSLIVAAEASPAKVVLREMPIEEEARAWFHDKGFVTMGDLSGMTDARVEKITKELGESVMARLKEQFRLFAVAVEELRLERQEQEAEERITQSCTQ